MNRRKHRTFRNYHSAQSTNLPEIQSGFGSQYTAQTLRSNPFSIRGHGNRNSFIEISGCCLLSALPPEGRQRVHNPGGHRRPPDPFVRSFVCFCLDLEEEAARSLDSPDVFTRRDKSTISAMSALAQSFIMAMTSCASSTFPRANMPCNSSNSCLLPVGMMMTVLSEQRAV